jgi:hypothetical protein
LRERVVAAIEGGMSTRQAAMCTSSSTTMSLVHFNAVQREGNVPHSVRSTVWRTARSRAPRLLFLSFTMNLILLPTSCCTHRGTEKNCKNFLPDCPVGGRLVRKVQLKGAGDTLPNDQLALRISVAFLFECFDALNKVAGQNGMSNWSELNVRNPHKSDHCPLFPLEGAPAVLGAIQQNSSRVLGALEGFVHFSVPSASSSSLRSALRRRTRRRRVA